MKITAKPGTLLETIFKQFYEQMEREKSIVAKYITDFSGVEPSNYSYYWYNGITCDWVCDKVRFPENSHPQNMLPYTYGGKTYYRPDFRLRKSKEFLKKWNETFTGIDGSILIKFGIPVMDENTGIYCNWLPCFIKGRYGIDVTSSLLDRMPKIDNKQYEIEL